MSPAATACAAKCTACWLEPHIRFKDTPGTSTGSVDSNTASRAGLAPCSPASVTVPSMTSSILCGSMPARASKPSITCASKASGLYSRNAPPRRPKGVRTASMITASAMSVFLRLRAPPNRSSGITAEPDRALLHAFENDRNTSRRDHPFQPVVAILAHHLPAFQHGAQIGHFLQHGLHLRPHFRHAVALVHTLEPGEQLRSLRRQVTEPRRTVQIGDHAKIAPAERIAVEPWAIDELPVEPRLQLLDIFFAVSHQ